LPFPEAAPDAQTASGPSPETDEDTMKKYFAIFALAALAACNPQEEQTADVEIVETPAVDASAPAAEPVDAPAADPAATEAAPVDTVAAPATAETVPAPESH
jgi:hypothetical protein